MATIAVLSVLGSVASFLILDAVDSYMDSSTTTQLHGEASVAMERMMREIRQIELDAGASGIAPNITAVHPESLDWENSTAATYQLIWTDPIVTLSVQSGPAATLLTDVSAFTIKTYDEDDGLLGADLTGAQCDPVRRIEIEVTLERAGVSETVRCRTYIRSTTALN